MEDCSSSASACRSSSRYLTCCTGTSWQDEDTDPSFGESLLALGLRVEELEGSEVSSAIRYRRKRPNLSLPDAFALALAAARRWTLLTGDGVLRAFAARLSVVCHGVLWILDQMLEVGISSPTDLLSGLTSIRDHPRCRLPRDEIASRLALYSSVGESS